MNKKNLSLALLFFALVLSACSAGVSQEVTVPQDALPTLEDGGQSGDAPDLTQDPAAEPFHMVYEYDDFLYTGVGPLENLVTLKVGDYGDDEFRDIENKQLTLMNNAATYFQDFLGNEHEKLLLNKEQFFCDVTVLGYDEQYAYAKTLCQEYTVDASGTIAKGSGQGDWIRFEYAPADLSIVDFKMIGNDTNPNRLIPQELLDALNAQ